MSVECSGNGVESERRFLVSGKRSGLLVMLVVFVGAYGRTVAADPGTAQGKATSPSRPGVLKAGPTRTDEEIVACRKEEYARSRGAAGGEVQAPAEPVKLRSTPRKLTVKECDAQARRWNFWSEENEAKGCFVNMFVIQDGVLTQDVVTGLSWDAGSQETYTYPEVLALLQKTNARAWEGHSDWRMPTTEELYSIFESVESVIRHRHLDERFFMNGDGWWSADTSEKKGHHMGVSMTGSCDPFDDTTRRSVFFVRAMSHDDWEKARREYKPPRRREP